MQALPSRYGMFLSIIADTGNGFGLMHSKITIHGLLINIDNLKFMIKNSEKGVIFLIFFIITLFK